MNQSLLERLLSYYHITYDEYLKLVKPTDLSNFATGNQFDDIDKAVNLVKEAVKNKKKIIVYGDYDADGIMGTSILVKMFQYLDVIVDYYIPNRYSDGYGLNMVHAQEYVDKNYDLVITVDNGITANEPIEVLHSNGVKVLILDHHQVGETLPKADAICHPTFSHFGETPSSGAFTAFMFSIALLGRVDKYLATLASISLISDMMPLLDYNRNLLRAVFDSYQIGEFLPIDLLGDNEVFNESLIGMKIAPRINSIGRLCEDQSINKIVEYFTTSNKEFILNYYSHILEMNEARKQYSKIDLQDLNVSSQDKAIVVQGDFKEGIIGLIANSLMMKYRVPVIVFSSPNSEDIIKGSGRCPEGCDIVDIFSHLSSYILTSGGHALAGGCSINVIDLESFKKEFISYAGSIVYTKPETKCIDLGINEMNIENYELISSFGPFGESWVAPLFKLRHIKVDTLTYSRDHKHIITTIGNKQKLVYFNYSKNEIENNKYVDAIGQLQLKSFNGFNYLEFSVKEFKSSI